jgi:hypothetical protein
MRLSEQELMGGNILNLSKGTRMGICTWLASTWNSTRDSSYLDSQLHLHRKHRWQMISSGDHLS